MSENGSGAQMLHTMIRVKDLDKSIDFYTGLLGMKLLRRNDYPGGKFTLAFVGYGDESSNAVIELTPDTPLIRASHDDAVSSPTGVTMPIPVT